MVKKAKADEPQQPEVQPAANSGKNGNGGRKVGGVFRFTLITLFAVTATMVIGAWLLQTRLLNVGEASHGSQLATAYARQYAGFFDQIFTQAARQLSSAAANANITSAVASGDPALITQTADTIAALLANKSQVFLITNSTDVATIPLGFAAQNMVERVRRGEEAKAEVIPLKDRPLLLLAYSVRDAQQQVIGALLVGFDLNEISTNLKVFDGETGHMSLIQRFEDANESQAVFEYGAQAHAGSPYVSVSPTLHPNLSVEFRLNPAAISDNSEATFWIAMAIMMVLVLASILATSLLVRQALRRNASMLLQYAENLVKRTPPPVGIQFDIDVFDEVAQSLGRTARGLLPEARGGATGTGTRRAAASADPLEVEVADSGFLDQPQSGPQLADEIFRAYDIRGIVGKTLTEDGVRAIGQAIGSAALEKNQSAIYVGRDGRLSGPQLVEALIQGLTAAGCRVINLGMVPTPLVYFACANTGVKSGVVLTGSHNPADHNGLKIVIDGETLSEQRIQDLKERIRKGNLRSGKGSAETLDITPKYMERVKDDIVLARPMKVVVDCGNGIAGAIAPQLLTAIGCTVIPLYCDVDGHFPNHHPDPSKPDNLDDLISKVTAEKADLGIAFDGDGDRLGVVTPQGNIIWPDRLMMLFAKDLLMRNPGADIIFDVKCTRDLATVISQNGGRPVMWRTGHSLIKAKMKETGAALAGEMSGHIFFNDRWFGFDDGIYSASRLLEILSLEVAPADEVFAEFPANHATPELHINVSEDAKFRIIEALQKKGDFSGGSVNTIDGVRVDYPSAWGLVRASNTSAVLVCRFEGKTQEDLDKVRTVFRDQLLKIEPSLRIAF